MKPPLARAGANDADGTFYRAATEPPFRVSGFPGGVGEGGWNRVPTAILASLPEGLAWVAPQPSGGMIRFRSDAAKLHLRVSLFRAEKSPAVTPAAGSGFCLYRGSGRDKTFTASLAPTEPVLEYESRCDLEPGGAMTEWTLYTPLQNPIRKIEIGLAAGARLEEPTPHSLGRPILFYGSSITCGFCASRPGLTYPARLCRELDAELINFGFGGNARGETRIAEIIAGLELAALVIDYDHNAPDAEHLRATHRPFFEIVRRSRPDLPILFVSSPNYHKAPEFFQPRRQIILATLEEAQRRGDRLIWFVDGARFFPPGQWADVTVDRLHPNDAGFARMAEAILPALSHALTQ